MSFCIGGLFSSATRFYNNLFNDGLEMLSIVVAVTYNGRTSNIENNTNNNIMVSE